MLIECWLGNKMTNYLLKNLISATVIILTVGVSGAWAQLPGQPANSYVSGSNWYCKEGYQKNDNECVSIFSSMDNKIDSRVIDEIELLLRNEEFFMKKLSLNPIINHSLFTKNNFDNFMKRVITHD